MFLAVVPIASTSQMLHLPLQEQQAPSNSIWRSSWAHPNSSTTPGLRRSSACTLPLLTSPCRGATSATLASPTWVLHVQLPLLRVLLACCLDDSRQAQKSCFQMTCLHRTATDCIQRVKGRRPTLHSAVPDFRSDPCPSPFQPTCQPSSCCNIG